MNYVEYSRNNSSPKWAIEGRNHLYRFPLRLWPRWRCIISYSNNLPTKPASTSYVTYIWHFFCTNFINIVTSTVGTFLQEPFHSQIPSRTSFLHKVWDFVLWGIYSHWWWRQIGLPCLKIMTDSGMSKRKKRLWSHSSPGLRIQHIKLVQIEK